MNVMYIVMYTLDHSRNPRQTLSGISTLFLTTMPVLFAGTVSRAPEIFAGGLHRGNDSWPLGLDVGPLIETGRLTLYIIYIYIH